MAREPKRRKRVPVACEDCGADLGAHLTGTLVACQCGNINRARIVPRRPCPHDGGGIEYGSGVVRCDRCFAVLPPTPTPE